MHPLNPLVRALDPITSRVRTDITAKKIPAGGSIWTADPLTDERIAKHLNGGPARGCCPMKPGESTTMVAVLDLDSHKGEVEWAKMCEVAQTILDLMELLGYSAQVFRSSGGKGIHIYLVWDTPQDAYSVREFLKGVLDACGFTDGTKGVAAGQIEIFPKQDEVDVDGHGSQVILPLAGESEPLEPLADWQAMGKAHALTLTWVGCPDVPVVPRPVRSLAISTSVVDLAVFKSALDAIPNSGADELDYDDWRDVVFAIHNATGGSAEGLAWAHEFSARASKYDKVTLERRTWPYIKNKPGGVTWRTVMSMAVDQGWNDPTEVFPIIVPIDNDPPPMRRARSGEFLATISNLQRALYKPGFCGMQIRYDHFKDEVVKAEPDDDQWSPFADEDYTRLRVHLENRGFKPVPKEMIRDVVLATAKHFQFDTAIEWLRQKKWDGIPRVEMFFTTYLGASDSPYTRAVARYIWSAMAGRVLEPGAKVDMVPILVGEQGSGKTTGVKAMVPSELFHCEISFGEKEDDLSRKMRGRLVAEIGELHGLHTKAEEGIKAFITRQHENWVPKYREFATKYPRRLVFIGTTNQEEFLADQTGNRRFLPVQVGTTRLEDLQRDCDQLWAEATLMFKASGIQFREAQALAAEVHAAHMIRDVWETTVADWLDRADPITAEVPRTRKFLRIADVLQDALSVPAKSQGRREELRMGAVLRTFGYERKKVRDGNRTIWAYVPHQS